MRWANFLHFYQPAGQQADILEAVVNQSYRPIFKGVESHKNVRLSLNINGALLELFDIHGYRDLIDALRSLVKEERIELTGSAKYHAFLPFLEKDEIIRQIKINDETLKFFFGKNLKTKGFFPPEMAYKEELTGIIAELGFEWIILDEIACSGQPGEIDYKKIYKIKNTNLLVFFRERRISNLIMSAVVRTVKDLKQILKEELKTSRYLITAMDGETFGHHRPGLEKLLFKLFGDPQFELIKISHLPQFYQEVTEVKPVESTWASSPEDIKKNIQFLSWRDPQNPIHQWQWELLNLVTEEFKTIDKSHPRYAAIRKKMDVALASDHFWWASAKPWWSLEMIEDGAWRLLGITRLMPGISEEKLKKASQLYEKIISTAFQWQRSGRIRKMAQEQKSILRIPFKERTVGRGGTQEGVFWAFIEMMKTLEKKAAREGEYEKAILWRDAIYKLENKFDIYDALNAVDLLRVHLPHQKIEKTIAKYKEKYRQIRGGQPEQRGT